MGDRARFASALCLFYTTFFYGASGHRERVVFFFSKGNALCNEAVVGVRAALHSADRGFLKCRGGRGGLLSLIVWWGGFFKRVWRAGSESDAWGLGGEIDCTSTASLTLTWTKPMHFIWTV